MLTGQNLGDSNLKKIAFVFAVSALVTGCATPAAYYNFDKSRVIDAPKDVVWSRIIGNFAANSVPIKTIEKASGIIYAESRLAKPSYKDKGKILDWADCGIDSFAVPQEREVAYNVFVVEEVSSKTRVTVNTTFTEIRQNALTAPALQRVNCNSTGSLEKAMLDVAAGVIEKAAQ